MKGVQKGTRLSRSSFQDFQNLGAIAVGALLLGTQTACKQPVTDETAANTGTPSTTITVPGIPNETRGMFVEVLRNDNYAFDIHDTTSVAATNASNPCEITTPGTAVGAGVEKLCVVEAAELDLHYFGLKLNFNVPTSLGCSYVSYHSPWFFYDEVGEGATGISYSKNADGTVNGAVTVTQYTSSSATTSIPISNATAVASLTPSQVATCKFDYTDKGGPNCCTGQYNLSVTSVDASGTPTTTTGEVIHRAASKALPSTRIARAPSDSPSRRSSLFRESA